jgi:hypothetical protein
MNVKRPVRSAIHTSAGTPRFGKEIVLSRSSCGEAGEGGTAQEAAGAPVNHYIMRCTARLADRHWSRWKSFLPGAPTSTPPQISASHDARRRS